MAIESIIFSRSFRSIRTVMPGLFIARASIACVLAYPLSFAVGAAAPKLGSDHLLPIGEGVETSYKDTLRRKLFVTESDFLRITNLNGGTTGECSIAFHWDNSGSGVFITCTKAETNLGNATWEANPNRIDEALINVTRKDLSFPPPVAEVLLKAMKRTLSQTAEREKTGRAQGIIFDGLQIMFSADSDRKQQEGLLTPECKGRRMQALRAIAKLSLQYCLQDEHHRQAVAKKIEREANTILNLR